MSATRFSRAAAAMSLLLAAVTLSACSDDNTTTPDAPSVISVVSGSGESIVVGSTVPDTLIVMITTVGSNPARNTQVNWSIVDGDGTLSAQTSTTDADGRALVAYNAGHIAGTVQIQASSPGVNAAIFTITQAADAPHDAETVDDEPTNVALGAGAVELLVRVVDEFGNPVPNAVVHWSVTGGDGNDNFDLAQSTTDENGIAAAEFTAADVAGARTIHATTDAGPSVDIELDVLPASIVKNTHP